MDEIGKITSRQLYNFWKNLSTSLLIIAGLIAVSAVVPFYVSPILALVAAAILYTMLYNGRLTQSYSCMLVFYSVFLSLVVYSIVSIIINFLYVWDIANIPHEFLFLTDPYIPSLILCPLCFLTIGFIYLRRKHLKICIDCRIKNGEAYGVGRAGNILTYESHFQLKNLIAMFFILSLVTWIYYLNFYVNTNVNQRDWYVFVWLVVILFLVDEIYFMSRYYNLYLDLKESNEILSEEELMEMTPKTYVRYYVICGEDIFVNHLPLEKENSPVDTPFVFSRSSSEISLSEIKNQINSLTGINDGELRFFYGRKLPELRDQSLVRYFYFLEGNTDDYPQLESKGVWVNFDVIKRLYSTQSNLLSKIFVRDTTRLATIILTQKIFRENGVRRNKLKSFRPSFTLSDIQKNDYDFQDDKWIKISIFNSDSKVFRIRKWVKNLFVKDNNKENIWR